MSNDHDNTSDTSSSPAEDVAAPRYQHDEPTRLAAEGRNVDGSPFWTSYQTPASYPVRAEVKLPPHLPGIIIFVHGVNSEGEWYDDAEKALCDGLNDRLNRADLAANKYVTTDKDTGQPCSCGTDPNKLGRSPVIRFYWGYRAPDGGEKQWRIPLRNEWGADCWNPQDGNRKGPWYWGGGPFQNGTNNLLQLWSDEGMKQHVLGFFDVQSPNPLTDRDLESSPPRHYFAHAAQRLAKLVDRIREVNPGDTVTIMSHSQGTMLALAATALCKERAPDAVIVMNSPYALDDKVTDQLTCGNQRQTVAARVNTLKAIAARLKQDKKVFTGKELKQLHCGATQDMQLWQPDAVLKNGVKERDNHGRLYVYFNPHDRVMGASPLQSIGWQGINDSVLAQLGDNVKQRMLARGTACGDEPGVKKFSSLPLIPDPEPGVKPTEFWNGNQTMLGANIWTVPKANQTVTINAEKVPVPIKAEDMAKVVDTREITRPGSKPKHVDMYFDQSRSSQYLWGAKDGDGSYKDSSFPYFESIYIPRQEVLQRDPHDPSRLDSQNPARRETVDELHRRIENYQPWPSNHSTLPKHAAFVRQVAAYDVPIGFCDSYESFDFWRELMVSADWTLQARGLNVYCKDTYFTACELNVPKIPAQIDPQTVSKKMEEEEAQQYRQIWGGMP